MIIPYKDTATCVTLRKKYNTTSKIAIDLARITTTKDPK